MHPKLTILAARCSEVLKKHQVFLEAGIFLGQILELLGIA